ncbi:sigma-70 family RNA polymerase sigma factor [Streptomyces sp. TLI_146]|uniref:sigma-70 family RNA polymerase sigma factor n=1 Tax=Streptomyces sp. TLI_146 TaxID=1938858 RepID=UPI000C70436D|nr:sigma-70 family RNA polymerase sigma factor [Streptomyces sp. TLI_146]PKV83683.1 RNA polymerase sigma factor (sigma-70 family) [Streptomyces sp. TLI_146]
MEYGTATVEAARAGDQHAQDELVAACLPLVYNIVGRALNGHADVDDVVQESVLRMLDGLAGLRDPGSFRSWVVAITMNQLRQYWQRARTRPDGTGIQETSDLPDPGADFVDLTILRLGLSGQRREAAEATRWLEPEDRGLLSLWWLETAGCLTRAEVAASLELSPQHTAVRVQRMKERLDASRQVVRTLAVAPRCHELTGLLSLWDGVPSSLWRKRITRHTRVCPVCSGLASGLVPPEGLLAGLALVPVASAAGLFAALAAHRGMAPMAYGTAGSAQPPRPPSAPGRHRQAPRGKGAHAEAASRSELRRDRDRARRRRRAAAVLAGATAIGGLAVVIHVSSDPSGPPTAVADAPADVAVTAASPEGTAATGPTRTPNSPSPKPSSSPSPSRSAASPKPTAPSTTPHTTAARTPSSHSPKVPNSLAKQGSTAQQVIALVNTERAKNGCGPVSDNSRLATAAQRHSDNMAAQGFFDHTDPSGAGPGERIHAAGYQWSTYGENIARGQQTPADVMNSWMNSPGHRANILNCAFKELGVGIHNGAGGPWWTQDFGTQM